MLTITSIVQVHRGLLVHTNDFGRSISFLVWFDLILKLAGYALRSIGEVLFKGTVEPMASIDPEEKR